MKRSPITGKRYNIFSRDILHLVNLDQCAYYIEEWDLVPLDIVLSEDRNRPGKKIVVFIFDKDDTKDAYAAWMARKDG